MSRFEGELQITDFGRNWRLDKPLAFVMGAMEPIVVPAGFESDLASVPGAVKPYIDDDAPCIRRPSVVHDYLYSCGGVLPDGRRFTRKQCDEILREAMIACGARPAQARVVYWAVQMFGGSHWSSPPQV